jgi:PhnB protein
MTRGQVSIMKDYSLADEAVANAVKLGAASKGPVMDMFWGDRCGTVVDPQGYIWMVATHIARPTPKEMEQKMTEQMANQQAVALRVAPE